MTSSKIGANDQYAMLWVVVLSVLFMMLFMTFGAKLGAVTQQTPGELISRKVGRWLAVLLGIGVFLISAAFQSGNNIGVAAVFEAFFDSKSLVTFLIVAFNLLAVSFLFLFKDLYRVLEKLMTMFVAIMLICFAINLVTLKPDLGAMAGGFLPSFGGMDDMMPVLGLIGTTFVITAAYYQAYLVQQKGWGIDDVQSGLVDARIGSIIMFCITVMLMSTAAAGLYTGKPVVLANPVAVASSLETTFGPLAKVIFCLGLFSAAYSSFLVNSMIGGFILSDGLGLGIRSDDLGPKILTTGVLLVGCLVALAVVQYDFDRTPTIIAAQAVTVVAAPLVAMVLLWLTSSKDVMQEHVNRPASVCLGWVGVLLLLAIAGKTAFFDLPPKIDSYLQYSEASLRNFATMSSCFRAPGRSQWHDELGSER